MKTNKLSDEQLAHELVQLRDEQASPRSNSQDAPKMLSLQLDSAKRVMALLAKARPVEAEAEKADLSLQETLASQDTKPDQGDRREFDSEQMPSTIGRFEIESLLGQGGFGLVFLARDPDLDRKVAIKVPTFCSLINEDAQIRFKRESRIVATLSHPNIVPVYEVGNDGPISFIASKFIQGSDLAKWIHEHGTLNSSDAAHSMSVIAEAIQHAHSRGVVHRDLKPANILVPTTESENLDPTSVCVVDFGLAKFLSESDDDQTRTGSIIGTPAFSAPEQLESTESQSLSELSDIYSLGAVLHFLLTGVAPFEANSLSEMVNKVRNETPLAPKKRNPLVPGDLSAICLKCLEKSPKDRYPTAHELKKDLDRFIHGESVLARPLPVHQRLWKWCRRNPTIATLSLVATTAVVGGLIASLWSASNARVAANESRQQYLDSKKVIDDYFVKVGERPLFGSTAFRKVKEELLESALAYYRKFVDENPDDTDLRLDLARIHHRLGDSLLEVNNLKEAEKEYQASLELIGLAESEADNEDKLPTCQLLRSMNLINLGSIDFQSRENESALAQLNSAIKLLEELQSEQSNNEEILLELVQAYSFSGEVNSKSGDQQKFREFAVQTQVAIEEFATSNTLSPMLENQLAISIGTQAICSLRTNEMDNAAKLLDEAIAISSDLVESQPMPVLFAETLAKHLTHRGMVDLNRGEMKESVKFLRQADEMLESLAMLNTSPDFVSNHRDVSLRLGYVLSTIGKWKEAMEANAFAVESSRRLVRDHPDVVGYKTDLASVCFTICGIKTHTLKLKEAEKFLNEGREVILALREAGVTDPDVKRLFDGIPSIEAKLFLYQRRYEEALDTCEKHLSVMEERIKESPDPRVRYNLSIAYENRAFVCIQLENYEQAAKDRAKVLEMTNGSQRPMYLLFLAEALALSGGVAEAQERIEEYNDSVTASTPNPRGRAMEMAFAQTAIASAIKNASQNQEVANALAEKHFELAEEAFLKSVDLEYFIERPWQIEFLNMRPDLNALAERPKVKPIVEEQTRIWENTK